MFGRGGGGRGGRSRGGRGGSSYSRSMMPIQSHADDDDLPAFDWVAKRKEWDQEKQVRFAGLSAVVKDFYKEDPAVANMTKVEVAKCRLENRKISVTNKDHRECDDAPNPVRTFREAWQHYPELLVLLEGRYEKPSPIQMQLWPVLLSGRDAIGIAQTGTGKTLAFLLPGLVNIMNQLPETEVFHGPRMVVIAPTRELAQQIDDEVNKLGYSKIRSVCIYGKGDRRKQIAAVNSGVEVVVATPGRLDDLLRAEQVDLRRVSYVVFDEADKMLDMGFMANLVFIISGIRGDRHFVMTSATWNDDIHYISKNYLSNELLVRVGERDLEAASTVTQEVRVCEDHEKFALLMEYVSKCTRADKGIVFVNRRTSCDPLHANICSHYNYKFTDDTMVPETLYGSMDQEAREEALQNFREGKSKLLICTDVASRGLDVIDVTFVIHYDLPMNMEDYVHRSGRTGRAGRTGHVLSFVCWQDRRKAAEFIEILQRSKVTVPSELRRLADRASRQRGSRAGDASGQSRGWRGNSDNAGPRSAGSFDNRDTSSRPTGSFENRDTGSRPTGSFDNRNTGSRPTRSFDNRNTGSRSGRSFNNRYNSRNDEIENAPIFQYKEDSAAKENAPDIVWEEEGFDSKTGLSLDNKTVSSNAPVSNINKTDHMKEDIWNGPIVSSRDSKTLPHRSQKVNETISSFVDQPASGTLAESASGYNNATDYTDGSAYSTYNVSEDGTYYAANQYFYPDTGTPGTYAYYGDQMSNTAAEGRAHGEYVYYDNEGNYVQDASQASGHCHVPQSYSDTGAAYSGEQNVEYSISGQEQKPVQDLAVHLTNTNLLPSAEARQPASQSSGHKQPRSGAAPRGVHRGYYVPSSRRPQ